MRNESIQNQRSPKEEGLQQSPPVQVVSSKELLQGQRELQILHGSDMYRLTLTRSGKLILHK
jgi:hemin uptake protein HemP